VFTVAGRVFMESERFERVGQSGRIGMVSLQVYDMLPMLCAPVGGELVPRDFTARPLQPTAATLPQWEQARALAAAFWHSAAADARVSAGFRAIAAENARHIALS
jgi:hypothetical protein